MMSHYVIPMAGALLLSCIIMTLVWWRQLFTKNAGIVDAWWSYNFGFIALYYALINPGDLINKIIIMILVLIWSFRLGTHLLIRNSSHTAEDTRYRKLRHEYGKNENFRMWLFFMYQAISNVLLSLPFLLSHSDGTLNISEIVGIIVWCVAILGESIADHQLKVFKSDPFNKGKVCQVGLWNYSRHPNYFFEWLVWISYAIIASGSPIGWVAWISPFIMFLLLTKVTGIPMLEELALKSKGQLYAEYQKTTSAFFPMFKRKL